MDKDRRLAELRKEISVLTPLVWEERRLSDEVWCRDCVPRYTRTIGGRCMLITWIISILLVVGAILLLTLTDVWSKKNVLGSLYILIAPLAAFAASLFTMFCDRGAQAELDDSRRRGDTLSA